MRLDNDVVQKPWYYPSFPERITAYPWLHPSAVNYLESILCPEYSVLEEGGGGSTLWFAERVNRVVTVEHDGKWADCIRSLAPANVTLLADLPQPGLYDVFMIDGPHEERRYCLENAHLYSRAWVVLDNANRPEYVMERMHLARHFDLCECFDNNIPSSKYFVTEFWLCRE